MTIETRSARSTANRRLRRYAARFTAATVVAGAAALFGASGVGAVEPSTRTVQIPLLTRLEPSAADSISDTVRTIPDMAVEAAAALDTYRATLDRDDLRSYVALRAETASAVAEQLGFAERDMVIAWSEPSLDHQRAVLAALSQLGVPYRSHTSEAGVGFDCSGLTSYAWGAAGFEILRSSGDQIRAAQTRTVDTATAGDLVYYPGHVMMYLGVGDAIVHSIQPGRDVELDHISERRINSVKYGDPT